MCHWHAVAWCGALLGLSGALCPRNLSIEPNNAGCSWHGQVWLTQPSVLEEVLWGNKIGSISTMTTLAPVSAVQKQNSKKCYHTKSYADFVLQTIFSVCGNCNKERYQTQLFSRESTQLGRLSSQRGVWGFTSNKYPQNSTPGGQGPDCES